jgi:hypothetical protein
MMRLTTALLESCARESEGEFSSIVGVNVWASAAKPFAEVGYYQKGRSPSIRTCSELNVADFGRCKPGLASFSDSKQSEFRFESSTLEGATNG